MVDIYPSNDREVIIPLQNEQSLVNIVLRSSAAQLSYPKPSVGELPGQQSQDDGDSSEHNKGGEASDKAAALVGVKVEAGIIERWTIQRHGDHRLEEPSGTTGVPPPPQSSRTIAR